MKILETKYKNKKVQWTGFNLHDILNLEEVVGTTRLFPWPNKDYAIDVKIRNQSGGQTVRLEVGDYLVLRSVLEIVSVKEFG